MLINQAIGTGDLSEVLVKRLRTPGGAPAPNVAPEVFPTMALEVDRPEWGWLKGEMRFAAWGGPAGVVGQLSRVRLINPAGTNTIAVVTRIYANAVQGLELVRAPLMASLITNRPTAPIDTRRVLSTATLQNSRLTVTQGGEVGSVPSGVSFAFLGQNIWHDYRAPIVIAPNGHIEIVGTVVNTAILAVNVEWYERQANPGELP